MNPFVTTAELHERGWSSSMITKLLGSEDTVDRKPVGGRRMRLYLTARVELVEKSQAFKTALRQKQLASLPALQVSNAKKRRLEIIVSEIQIPDLSLLEKTLPVAGSQLALETLLDSLKELEADLDSYAWHTGIRKARQLLRQRVLAQIIEQCPSLKIAAETELAGMG